MAIRGSHRQVGVPITSVYQKESYPWFMHNVSSFAGDGKEDAARSPLEC